MLSLQCQWLTNRECCQQRMKTMPQYCIGGSLPGKVFIKLGGWNYEEPFKLKSSVFISSLPLQEDSNHYNSDLPQAGQILTSSEKWIHRSRRKVRAKWRIRKQEKLKGKMLSLLFLPHHNLSGFKWNIFKLMLHFYFFKVKNEFHFVMIQKLYKQ